MNGTPSREELLAALEDMLAECEPRHKRMVQGKPWYANALSVASRARGGIKVHAKFLAEGNYTELLQERLKREKYPVMKVEILGETSTPLRPFVRIHLAAPYEGLSVLVEADTYRVQWKIGSCTYSRTISGHVGKDIAALIDQCRDARDQNIRDLTNANKKESQDLETDVLLERMRAISPRIHDRSCTVDDQISFTAAMELVAERER